MALCGVLTLVQRLYLPAAPIRAAGQGIEPEVHTPKMRIFKLRKSQNDKAEQLFSKPQKKTDSFLKQKEKAWQESQDKMARLKELRLAKEASDNESMEAAGCASTAAKKKKS
jgi:hypothetical protein